MFYRSIIIGLSIVTLSACVTQPISLKKDVHDHIESIDHIVVIPQNNLDISVAASNPGNSGILGALIVMAIDSSRQSSAEEESTPIINELEGYDFRSVMLTAMKSEIEKRNDFKQQIETTLESVESESIKQVNYIGSKSDAVLYSNIRYKLESGNLIITSIVEMYPKSTKLKSYRSGPNDEAPIDEGNLIYYKTFTFKKQAISVSNIKSSLQEGALNIANQTIRDLSHPI